MKEKITIDIENRFIGGVTFKGLKGFREQIKELERVKNENVFTKRFNGSRYE